MSAIEELLAKYGGQLGGQAVMYRMLAAKNFASVRAYAKMDSVFTYMLAYDSPYLDDQTRKGIASGLKQCRKIARLPRTEVIDRSRAGSPRHGRHEAGGGSILPGRGLLRQKREDPAGYRSLIHFDRPEPGRRTGCPYISGFAVDGPGIIHETGNSRLPANRIHHPQKRDLLCLPRRSGGTESGSDRRFGHHTDPGDAGDFDAEEVEHGTITFDTGKQPQTGIANFMLKDNIPYLWLELNGIPAMMHWDTGMNAKPRLSGKFYAEHASSLPKLGSVRRGSEITAAGAAEYRYHALGGICAKIGSREVILPEVRVVFDTEDMHTAEVPGYDGQMNNIVDVRRIRIDFENMCVTIE